jgi:hypothetical protein
VGAFLPPKYGLPHAVQVMGVDPLRFVKVDYSSARNDFGGVNNAPNYANKTAFATIKSDGSIMAWGNPYWYNRCQKVHLHLQNMGHPTP